MVALLKIPFADIASFPAKRYRLDNGLLLIHQRVTAAPVVTVDVWVKAGAATEPEPWSGMAHFLEHMIFKGTNRLLPGQFDQIIENRGGVTNAATSHDYAHFFVSTAAIDLPDTLPHLADLLLHAAIPDAEFELERDVVLEEIRQSFDDPDGLGFQVLLETLYQSHPYGRPVLGDAARLVERSPQEMRWFHSAHYQPENMTVVVVGDVEWETTLDLVSRAFTEFPSRADCPRPAVKPEPPLTGIRRQVLELPRLGLARLMLGWATPGIESLRSAYGMDLLSALLASGRTSRLVRELREERYLVQDISSGFSLQRDSSLFTLTAWVDPAHLDQVEAIIGDRLSELATAPVGEVELKRCQRLLCNDYAFSTETASQLAGLYGYYSVIAQPELAVAYPQVISSFQPEELQQLANQYLSPLRYAAVVLQPA
ncbi:MAG: pitrilysin family protein [Leptolyngbya sp. IPPAS B-1204]|uniref:M16 family metallopeptidase n=1 Tax=Leptolyngbya sp. NK1-12 TaxID=2547451 RepID=UPI00292F2FB9|nr:pitrilysin family protein [Leptolyngbya sp. NK1-12]